MPFGGRPWASKETLFFDSKLSLRNLSLRILPLSIALSSDIEAYEFFKLNHGKRKSRAKPPPKKRMDKLDTVFCCPFCNHGSSVECRIDMKNLIGEAACRICQESFSTTVTALTEPIDIYSEWIDECERVNNLDDDTA
uniref:Transcription elongation factor 1 homolog n=1 Tax=Ananas comosus var. bracteatus TaxID=296719 RepID=A0A6V7QGE6_ANACO|nr:unnamed protein product [Ananas comosus var. bracteatus]